MKTWKIEILLLISILILVNDLTNHLGLTDIIAAIAVLLSFGHVQISDRLSEQQDQLQKPTVHCYRQMMYYFIGKEICWLAFFCLTESYSALVGVIFFLLYPFYRKAYRLYIRKNRSLNG